MRFPAMIRHPSAFLPITMSLAALALVLAHVALSGAAHEADEGTAAHVFQWLMAAQLPVVAFFAIKWLPRAPRAALWILAAQLAAILVALGPVRVFGL